MKINIILTILFISILFYGSIEYSHGIVGLTKLNGDCCVCHNINPDQSVSVWIEGPDSVEINQTVTYRVYLTGGPAIAGGFNAASRTGILFPGDSTSRKIDLELTHTSEKDFTSDTIYWSFTYTAPASVQWDTLYSVAQSVNDDGIPNSQDKWNFSANFPVKVVPFVPVELISFSALPGMNEVTLNWTTGSETNNSGFEIERRQEDQSNWRNIGFIAGQGNSARQHAYIFKDNAPLPGKSYYRLKQLDYNGEFSYSDVVESNPVLDISGYELSQNYPNPFNPVTKIKYIIPESASGKHISLRIYDVAGRLVAEVVNEAQTSGIYEVEFGGTDLSSGIYYYTLASGDFTQTRKMVIIK